MYWKNLANNENELRNPHFGKYLQVWKYRPFNDHKKGSQDGTADVMKPQAE